jgi:hypothetical protein
MTNDKEQAQQSFKVQDNRRFEADGSDKETKGEDFIIKDSSNTQKESVVDPEINFSSFIMSLATQAMMQLGEMPAMEGQPAIPKNIIHAKQTIDVLSMIREKTKGNLDEFENQMFEDILHTLRMSFVKARA